MQRGSPIRLTKISSPFPDSPKRPASLETFLSMTDDAAANEMDNYKKFLEEVEVSQRNMLKVQSTCSIKMVYKLSHVFKTIPASSALEKNSSLTSIVAFYARLQATEYRSTFDSIDSSFCLKITSIIMFLRDFNVVPQLLTKDDCMFIWRSMCLEASLVGQKKQPNLDIEDIKDFLARGAILAYNKDGLRRLILSANTTMPTHAELVGLLCRHMQLDNFDHIFQLLNTVGQNRLENTRKENRKQMVDNLKKEHQADLEAKRTEQKATKLQETFDAQRATALHRILDPISDDDVQISECKQGSEKSISDVVSKGAASYTSSTAMSRIVGVANISARQDEELAKYDPQLKRIFDIFSANPQKKAKQANDGLTISDGSFLDLGEIVVGQKCSINMVIRNNCHHDIQYDIKATGFGSESTLIVAHPGSVASGLSRTVTVSFIVPDTHTDHLCHLDLSVLPLKGEPPIDIQCPIFYRAVRAADVSDRYRMLPVCTVRNLAELLRQYCGIHNSFNVSFDKTIDWYSGPGWKDGPHFESSGDSSKFLFTSHSTSDLMQIPGCNRGIRSTIIRQDI